MVLKFSIFYWRQQYGMKLVLALLYLTWAGVPFQTLLQHSLNKLAELRSLLEHLYADVDWKWLGLELEG